MSSDYCWFQRLSNWAPHKSWFVQVNLQNNLRKSQLSEGEKAKKLTGIWPNSNTPNIMKCKIIHTNIPLPFKY